MGGDAKSRVLILGGADTGKTTFVAQLYGRMQQSGSRFKVLDAPDDITPIVGALDRLGEGRAVDHTPTGTHHQLVLNVRAGSGDEISFSIPDYSGESLDSIVETRTVDDRWRSLVTTSDRWMVFIRLEKHQTPIPTLPLELGRSIPSIESPDNFTLPLDLRTVELLQILRSEWVKERGLDQPPDLSVVLTCWDEIGDIGASAAPVEVLQGRCALLAAYIEAEMPIAGTVWGLSSQGRSLGLQPDNEFVENGPEVMGYLVRPDGTRTADITEAIGT